MMSQTRNVDFSRRGISEITDLQYKSSALIIISRDESLSGFLIRVEGPQPHFYSEQIPDCLIEIKFAIESSSAFNLCDVGRRCMMDPLFIC